MLARAVIVVLALLTAAWLANSLRATQHVAEARALAPGPPSPPPTRAQAARALALLRGAERLNPSSEPQLAEAGVLLYSGRNAAAAAVLRPLVRREPSNVTAQAALYFALRGDHPAAAAAVARRIREVAPPVRSPR